MHRAPPARHGGERHCPALWTRLVSVSLRFHAGGASRPCMPVPRAAGPGPVAAGHPQPSSHGPDRRTSPVPPCHRRAESSSSFAVRPGVQENAGPDALARAPREANPIRSPASLPAIAVDCAALVKVQAATGKTRAPVLSCAVRLDPLHLSCSPRPWLPHRKSIPSLWPRANEPSSRRTNLHNRVTVRPRTPAQSPSYVVGCPCWEPINHPKTRHAF